jgi:hypothetical protein
MAGALLISENSSVSMSSLAFDHIVSAIRPAIERENPGLGHKLFESIDQAFDFVSLERLGRMEFKQCYEVLTAIHGTEMARGSGVDLLPVWQEILKALRADPRCS